MITVVGIPKFTNERGKASGYSTISLKTTPKAFIVFIERQCASFSLSLPLLLVWETTFETYKKRMPRMAVILIHGSVLAELG